MLIANIDTYEFGIVYNKNKQTAIEFLNELNIQFSNIFNIKIYYSDGNYNKEFEYLASKLRIKNNKRFTTIAFLYIEYLNIHITVVQHSSANYLTFKFYGLFQNNELSFEKSIFAFDFIKKLLEFNYKIRNVKVDIAIDFNLDFDNTVDVFQSIFKTINREPYLFKDNETVYFNSDLVNECLLNQKLYGEDLKCNQKNCYYNIIIYNKTLKNKLDYPLSRLEISFKNVFNLSKLKYLNKYKDIEIILNVLIKKIDKYLNNKYKITLQDYTSNTKLNLKDVSVNNINYLQEKKVI